MNKKNPLAVALGRLAKGKPKKFSKAEIAKRKARLKKYSFTNKK
jgi:hypothetical protein